MTTEDIIIQVFCLVDDQMKEVPKHSQAKLYPTSCAMSLHHPSQKTSWV